MNSIRYICAAAAASIVLCFGWGAFAGDEKAASSEKSGDNQPVMFVQTAGGAHLKDGKLTLMSPTTTFMSGKMVGKCPAIISSRLGRTVTIHSRRILPKRFFR
jgi:hypothetical protein